MILIMSDEIQCRFLEAFKGGRIVQVNARNVLFHAGTKIHHIYMVKTGRVSLVRPLASGARVILQTACANQVLAEASVYAKAYHCAAEAEEPTTLHRLAVRDFQNFLSTQPGAATDWAAHLARQTQSARMRAEIRSLRTVSDRLDAWLSLGNDLPPRGQWQDLADELGVSREALYRELARRRG